MIKKINFNEPNVKKILISILLIIAFVIQFSFLSYLIKGLMPDSEKNNANVIMDYNSKGDINYRVYLKPNDFISSPYLEEGEAYILDLIDYVQINSSYDFSSTVKTDVTGSNKLVARLKVYYKESTDKNQNPEVLQKERILDEKVIDFNDNKYGVTNTYNLYLDEYLKILEDFQDQIKIAADGYLEVSSETTFNGTVGGATYDNKYSNVIRIPLSDSVVKIETEDPEEQNAKVYEGDLIKTNKVVMTFVIIANIVTFAVICLLLRRLFMFTNRSKYEKEINKILKTYDDIIVNTNTVLDVYKYNIIEITEFKELLNLSRELLLPIMNYEVKKGEETWFYVVKDDILYRYIVSKNEDDDTNDSNDNNFSSLNNNANTSLNDDVSNVSNDYSTDGYNVSDDNSINDLPANNFEKQNGEILPDTFSAGSLDENSVDSSLDDSKSLVDKAFEESNFDTDISSDSDDKNKEDDSKNLVDKAFEESGFGSSDDSNFQNESLDKEDEKDSK